MALITNKLLMTYFMNGHLSPRLIKPGFRPKSRLFTIICLALHGSSQSFIYSSTYPFAHPFVRYLRSIHSFLENCLLGPRDTLVNKLRFCCHRVNDHSTSDFSAPSLICACPTSLLTVSSQTDDLWFPDALKLFLLLVILPPLPRMPFLILSTW